MEERRRGSETVRLEEEGGNRCLWGLLLPPPISSPTPIHVKTGGQNEMKSGTCWSGKKAKVGRREPLSVGCPPELTSPFFPLCGGLFSPTQTGGGAGEEEGKEVFLSLPYFCGPDLPRRRRQKKKRFKFDFGRQKTQGDKKTSRRQSPTLLSDPKVLLGSIFLLFPA